MTHSCVNLNKYKFLKVSFSVKCVGHFFLKNLNELLLQMKSRVTDEIKSKSDLKS